MNLFNRGVELALDIIWVLIMKVKNIVDKKCNMSFIFFLYRILIYFFFEGIWIFFFFLTEGIKIKT